MKKLSPHPALNIVIVAGGKGIRMGNRIPKQFIPLAGVPIICHTIRNFYRITPHAHFILVLPEEQRSEWTSLQRFLPDHIQMSILNGGSTRFESVKNGLSAIRNREDSITLVHDGVRPFVNGALIERCIETAARTGNAIPAIPVTDSIRQTDDNGITTPIDRSRLRGMQTPQTFQTGLLLQAFEQPFRESFTDEASVIEAMGFPVHLVAGDKMNIKITTPEDLIYAEALLASHLSGID